jgi:hypothetical protein
MKSKRNRFISKLPVTIFALLLLSVSCNKDFLDLKNPNDITADIFFKTTGDFKIAVNTLYNSAGSIIIYTGGEGAGFIQNSRGDDAVLTTGAFGEEITYANFLNGATSGHSDGLYSGFYNIIYRANTILAYMDQFDWTGNEDLKTSLSAEAYFFRGISYFYLAHYFGWVPIVTKPAVTEEDYNPAKAATIDDVYDQAIADLKLAKAGLPTTQEDKGRATKGAATGFLGKTYLYRAGYLNENANYALAAAEFKEVMDMGIYGLVAQYEDNFTAVNENNEESLFELQYMYDAALGTQTQGRIFNSVPGIGFEIFLRPSPWLMGTMAQEKTIDGKYDPRYLQTVYFQGGLPLFGVPYNQLGDGLSLQGGIVVGGAPDGSSDSTGGWWRKYLNVNLLFENTSHGGDNNERIMRYADILLMYAEAKVMADPADLTDATDAVKEVRDRANLPEKTYADAGELMEEIRHQRVMELTYENTRYFDLIRWGLLGEAIQDHGTAAQKGAYSPVKHKYFPLPLDEILNNKNLVQNEAWQ